MRSLDRAAVMHGGIYALVISGGAGLAAFVVDSPAFRGLMLLVIIFGYLFGGFVAGRGRFGDAARHGAAAAAAAFVVFQGTATLRRAVVGEPISVVGIISAGLTAAVCGALGGLLATRSPGPDAVRRRRRHS